MNYLIVNRGEELLLMGRWLELTFWDRTVEGEAADDLTTAFSAAFSLIDVLDQECIGNDDDNWAANDHFLSTFWLLVAANFELLEVGKFRWNQSSKEMWTASSTIVRKWVWFFELHSMKALLKK